MAPQEPEQGSWLPGSLRGLAPQEPEPGRLLPGVTIYHHPGIEPRTSQKEVPQPPRVQTRIGKHS